MKLTDHDLDNLVRSAVTERGARPLPFGLQRKIENRVRLVALIDIERGWFFRRLVWLAISFVFLLGAFLLTTYLAGGFGSGIIKVVPGGLGYLDYAATAFSVAWGGAIDQPVVIVVVVGAAVALLAAISAKSFVRNWPA